MFIRALLSARHIIDHLRKRKPVERAADALLQVDAMFRTSVGALASGMRVLNLQVPARDDACGCVLLSDDLQ